jgi:hypothetical protein
MKRLENFYKDINMILIVVVLAIEGLVVEQLKESKIEHEWVILLCSIVFLVFVFKLLGRAVEKSIENSECIRALILGADYIEGTWFDMVEIGGDKFYGLVTHSYNEGHIEQSGEQISANGSPQNTWNSLASKYEDNTLTIIYRVNYFDEAIIEQRLGISTIDFSKSAKHRSPTSFSGTFYDMSNNFVTKSFRGFKVTDEEILAQLENSQTKLQAIKKLIDSPYFKPIQ